MDNTSQRENINTTVSIFHIEQPPPIQPPSQPLQQESTGDDCDNVLIAWSIKDTTLLLEQVSRDEDWDSISQYLGNSKTAQQCNDWFDYLEGISKNFPKRQKTKSVGQPHRKRRKAAQIERLYKCQEKYCYRSYGTEGALKMHIKLKHPSVTYNENYQQQARTAAIISQNLDEAEGIEDELSEDEQPPQPVAPKKQLLTVQPVNFSDPYPSSKSSTSSNKSIMSVQKLTHPTPGPVILCGGPFSSSSGKRTVTTSDFSSNPNNCSSIDSQSPNSEQQQQQQQQSMDLFSCVSRRHLTARPKGGEFNPMQINFICK